MIINQNKWQRIEPGWISRCIHLTMYRLLINFNNRITKQIIERRRKKTSILLYTHTHTQRDIHRGKTKRTTKRHLKEFTLHTQICDKKGKYLKLFSIPFVQKKILKQIRIILSLTQKYKKKDQRISQKFHVCVNKKKFGYISSKIKFGVLWMEGWWEKRVFYLWNDTQHLQRISFFYISAIKHERLFFLYFQIGKWFNIQ